MRQLSCQITLFLAAITLFSCAPVAARPDLEVQANGVEVAVTGGEGEVVYRYDICLLPSDTKGEVRVISNSRKTENSTLGIIGSILGFVLKLIY